MTARSLSRPLSEAVGVFCVLCAVCCVVVCGLHIGVADVCGTRGLRVVPDCCRYQSVIAEVLGKYWCRIIYTSLQRDHNSL
jgi:hypothetical protein